MRRLCTPPAWYSCQVTTPTIDSASRNVRSRDEVLHTRAHTSSQCHGDWEILLCLHLHQHLHPTPTPIPTRLKLASSNTCRNRSIVHALLGNGAPISTFVTGTTRPRTRMQLRSGPPGQMLEPKCSLLLEYVGHRSKNKERRKEKGGSDCESERQGKRERENERARGREKGRNGEREQDRNKRKEKETRDTSPTTGQTGKGVRRERERVGVSEKRMRRACEESQTTVRRW